MNKKNKNIISQQTLETVEREREREGILAD